MPNEPQSLLDAVLTVRREHEAELLKRDSRRGTGHNRTARGGRASVVNYGLIPPAIGKPWQPLSGCTLEVGPVPSRRSKHFGEAR